MSFIVGSVLVISSSFSFTVYMVFFMDCLSLTFKMSEKKFYVYIL